MGKNRMDKPVVDTTNCERVVLDIYCPLLPNVRRGEFGWLERTPTHNVVWFDGHRLGYCSRRSTGGYHQITNYIRVIEGARK